MWTNVQSHVGNWKTRASAFPRWGVSLLLIAALPGILVAAAGAFLLGISIFIALLFVIPTYRLILLVTPKAKREPEVPAPVSPGSKPVTVRILD